MIKKLLGTVVLGMLLSGNAFAYHSNYSNCFTQKISEKKFKKYERNSFEEMNNFQMEENYVSMSDYGIINGYPVKAFKEISFINAYPNYLIVVREDENGSVNSIKREYNFTESSKDYLFYKTANSIQHFGSLVIHKAENIIELKETLLSGEKFSIFLKCKKEPIAHKINKKKTNKSSDLQIYYLILLGIISLINFGGIVYLIKRKK